MDVTDLFYASEAFIGYGAQLLVGQGDSPETFTAVPELNEISPLVSLTSSIIDVTHLRSPDATREKISGLSDSGTISCNGNYRPSHGAHLETGGDGFDATHNLIALKKSRLRNNYRIVMPEAHPVQTPDRSAVLPRSIPSTVPESTTAKTARRSGRSHERQ